MSRLSRWSLVVSLVALLMSIMTLIFAIQVSRSTSELKQTLSGNSQSAEAEMLRQFRPATAAEAAAIKSLPELQDDRATNRIYVATAKEVALVPVSQPMMLVLPQGHTWKSGPMSLITIMRVKSTSLNDLKLDGATYSDPLCTAQRAGILKGDCNDPAIQKAGNWKEMTSHLRRPTEAELRLWLGDHYVAGHTDLYYVATSDFVAAPEYRFNEVPGNILGIFVPPGVYVLGGQLGFMDLYPVTGPYEFREELMSLDSICFMLKADNDNGSDSFIPDSERQRVERCTRTVTRN